MGLISRIPKYLIRGTHSHLDHLTANAGYKRDFCVSVARPFCLTGRVPPIVAAVNASESSQLISRDLRESSFIYGD